MEQASKLMIALVSLFGASVDDKYTFGWCVDGLVVLIYGDHLMKRAECRVFGERIDLHADSKGDALMSLSTNEGKKSSVEILHTLFAKMCHTVLTNENRTVLCSFPQFESLQQEALLRTRLFFSDKIGFTLSRV